ncbi:hypothetical protein FRX31_021109, partial [Thalictrum thalictroides]
QGIPFEPIAERALSKGAVLSRTSGLQLGEGGQDRHGGQPVILSKHLLVLEGRTDMEAAAMPGAASAPPPARLNVDVLCAENEPDTLYYGQYSVGKNSGLRMHMNVTCEHESDRNCTSAL